MNPGDQSETKRILPRKCLIGCQEVGALCCGCSSLRPEGTGGHQAYAHGLRPAPSAPGPQCALVRGKLWFIAVIAALSMPMDDYLSGKIELMK